MAEGPISGSAFGSWVDGTVKDQIKIRQDIHAQNYGNWNTGNNSRLYQAYYENAPWVCLRSSVDEPNNNRDLAKRYVLCGGTLTYSEDGKLKFVRDGRTGAVGYGLDETYGYRPKPGITRVVVKTKDTFGCIMEADIDFTVWSKDDLEAVDRIYFKPGMSALLEWGHTTWVDNGGMVRNMAQSKLYSMEQFLNRDLFEIVDKNVQVNRESHDFDGNYEAIFGYITNFDWSFNNEGSYSCKLKILSKGSILEGLQIPARTKEFITQKRSGYEEERAALIKKYTTGTNPSDAQTRGVAEAYSKELAALEAKYKNWELDEDAQKSPYHYILRSILAQIKAGQKKGKDTLKNITWKDGSPADYDYWGEMYLQNKSDAKPIAFISLDTFLKITNKILEIAKVDFPRFETRDDSDYVEQGFTTFKEHFSLDPYKVILPFKPTTDDRNETINSDSSILKDVRAGWHLGEFLDNIKAFDNQANGLDKNNCIADLMVGVNFILQCVNQVIDEKAESYRVQDLVDNVLAGVQKALGNINAFGIHINHIKNTTSVVDRNCICHDPVDKKADFEIAVSGKSSTLTNLSVTSEVSTEMANQMSVAATTPVDSLGGVKGNSSIIIWNEGCVDRHRLEPKPEYKTIYFIDPNKELVGLPKEPGTGTFSNSRAFLDKAVDLYTKFFYKSQAVTRTEGKNTTSQEVSGEYEEGTFEILQNDGEALFQECLNRDIAGREDINPSTHLQNGIIPIRLSFTMKGIGRFIIGTTFKITEGLVPGKYKDWRHLITGVEHSIDSRGWFTTVNSLYYPVVLKKNKGKTEATTDNVRPKQCQFNPNVTTGLGLAARTIQGRARTIEAMERAAESRTGLKPSDKVSKYFTLGQFCPNASEEPAVTSFYSDNIPSETDVAQIKRLATEILDTVWESSSIGFRISSGFRSLERNTKAEGSATSQHLVGEAADLKALGGTLELQNRLLFDIIFQLIKSKKIRVGQLIWEKGNQNGPRWIHISLPYGNTLNQILVEGENYTANQKGEILKRYKL